MSDEVGSYKRSRFKALLERWDGASPRQVLLWITGVSYEQCWVCRIYIPGHILIVKRYSLSIILANLLEIADIDFRAMYHLFLLRCYVLLLTSSEREQRRDKFLQNSYFDFGVSFILKNMSLVFLLLYCWNVHAESSNIVTVETVLGTFELELLTEEAPATVENFLNYVDRGDFDGTFFHRSEPGFVLQGGGKT